MFKIDLLCYLNVTSPLHDGPMKIYMYWKQPC